MTARLVLSFDCEGKWGIADLGLDRQSALTSAALNQAYSTVLSTLRKHDAPATFAFVSALCLTNDQAKIEIEKNYEGIRYRQQHWLANALTSIRSENFEGWSEPGLISLVRQEPRHHICSHGGFHVPYDCENTPLETIDADLELIRSTEPMVGNEQGILVFPRNIVGHTQKLRESGFAAYRDTDPRELRSGLLGRVERFCHEFISFDRGDGRRHVYRKTDGVTALSPGKFLSASIGIRSRIPMSFTKKRIDTLFAQAVKNDSIVHFYSHPHNFIEDKTLNQKLDYMLRRASDLRETGELRIITMKEELDERQNE